MTASLVVVNEMEKERLKNTGRKCVVKKVINLIVKIISM